MSRPDERVPQPRHSSYEDRLADRRGPFHDPSVPGWYTRPSNCRETNLHNHFNQTVEFTLHLRLLNGESRHSVRQDFPTDGCLHRAFNRTESRERGSKRKDQQLSKMPTAEGEATMGTCPGNHVQAFVPSWSSLTSEYYFPERSTSGLKDSPRTVHNRSADAEPRGAKERAHTNSRKSAQREPKAGYACKSA